MQLNLNLKSFDELCQKFGWHKIKNDPNWIIYTKKHHETEYFEIQHKNKYTSVCIPIKEIPFQYKTQFFNQQKAVEYIEERFTDFNS